MTRTLDDSRLGLDSPAPGGPASSRRMQSGGSFVLDALSKTPVVWGEGDEVLAAEGESTFIVGPVGVGKTTLAENVVAGRMGVVPSVLGYPVRQGRRKTLYLACDRPQQIARGFRRQFGEEHRQLLDDRLIVWKGPLPVDLARHPDVAVEMCQQHDADTLVIDSVKDVAVGLVDDEVGAGLNRALQTCLAEGIEVVALHHQRKGQNGSKPKSLEDVYGSTWITAGAGSVIPLWGQPGDLIVELSHLKQPAAQVGPLQIEHDPATGTMTLHRGYDVLRALRIARDGLTAPDVARQWFERDNPSDNDRRKAKRALDRLVVNGQATCSNASRGGVNGTEAARYYPTDDTGQEPR